MKTKQRIQDAVEGKLPLEELTYHELRKLESLIFKAIASKKGASTVPPSKLKH